MIEAARKLAGAGARVILAVWTVAKGEQARAHLLAARPDADVEVRRIHLADLAPYGSSPPRCWPTTARSACC